MDTATRSLLSSLHSASLSQERSLSARHVHFPGPGGLSIPFDDQMVALDEEKALAMYLVLKSIRATRVVEAGTSYGVSLIWIIAAVLSSSSSPPSSDLPPLVIGTESSPEKASLARNHVSLAFPSRPHPLPFLHLLEGDLLSTLPTFFSSPDHPVPDASIDAVLLDIWTPLALPTLRLLLPKLRTGAVVFVDNVESSKERYKDLRAFLDDGANGFEWTTLPYSGGFGFCLYHPPPSPHPSS